MNKVSKTEDILFEALQYIGLNPKRQHLISKHHVDFAFPEKLLVVEVDGIHHRKREEVERDEKRRDIAENLGWRVKRFTAEQVYDNPTKIAWKIKTLLNSSSIKGQEKIIAKRKPKTRKSHKTDLEKVYLDLEKGHLNEKKKEPKTTHKKEKDLLAIEPKTTHKKKQNLIEISIIATGMIILALGFSFLGSIIVLAGLIYLLRNLLKKK